MSSRGGSQGCKTFFMTGITLCEDGTITVAYCEEDPDKLGIKEEVKGITENVCNGMEAKYRTYRDLVEILRLLGLKKNFPNIEWILPARPYTTDENKDILINKIQQTAIINLAIDAGLLVYFNVWTGDSKQKIRQWFITDMNQTIGKALKNIKLVPNKQENIISAGEDHKVELNKNVSVLKNLECVQDIIIKLRSDGRYVVYPQFLLHNLKRLKE